MSGSALMLFLSSFCCANFFCLADLNGWGELIQIAAPDVLSNAAKQEIVMSAVITSQNTTKNFTECVLSASECFIETLSIQAIDAQPGLLELVIRTQFLSAKNPAEKRVKSQTCIERSRLIELHQSIGQLLQATKGSPSELSLS